jgi:restriction system protein
VWLVSPFGVFVIETKNYKGWILGDEKQRQWTQQIYRKKNRFQNPLHQNQLHVRALMDFLALPESAFRSVIFFIGDATFKTPMPANVISKGLRPWIENHRETILDAGQVDQIRTALTDHERNTDRKAAAKQHLKDMKSRDCISYHAAF